MFANDSPFEYQEEVGQEANLYYIGIKIFAPQGTFSYTDTKTTAPCETDEFNRKYSIAWIPVASNDGAEWTYYGKDNIYFDYYSIEWHDELSKLINKATFRITLTNEDTYSAFEEYASISALDDLTDRVNVLEDNNEWSDF